MPENISLIFFILILIIVIIFLVVPILKELLPKKFKKGDSGNLGGSDEN